MSRKHSFSILVWVLRYRLKNGKAPLSIRITVNGERAEILANKICHAYRPGSPWVTQQSLSVNGKRLHITKADHLEVAKQMNIKRPEPMIDEILRVVGNWRVYAAKQYVADDLAKAIYSYPTGHPILRMANTPNNFVSKRAHAKISSEANV
jgi:hypothetical protein